MLFSQEQYHKIKDLVPDVLQVVRKSRVPKLPGMSYDHKHLYDYDHPCPKGIVMHWTISVLLDLEDDEVLSVYRYAGRTPIGSGQYMYHSDRGFTYYLKGWHG